MNRRRFLGMLAAVVGASALPALTQANDAAPLQAYDAKVMDVVHMPEEAFLRVPKPLADGVKCNVLCNGEVLYDYEFPEPFHVSVGNEQVLTQRIIVHG